MNQAEFLQQHAPDGNLTAEQAAQLLELSEEGDTGAVDTALEIGGEPGATAATEAKPEGEQEASNVSNTSDVELNADNAVILAKDGKHHIDFEVLAKSREGEKHWKGQANESQEKAAEYQAKYEGAMQELEALRAQPQKTAAAAIAPAEAAVIDAALEAGLDPDELLGDFSAEAIVKGMARVADLQGQKLLAQFESKLQQAVAPVQQSQQLSAQEAHAKTIHDVHPDIDSLVESQELKSWIDQQVAAQPSFQQAAVRAGFEQVLESGSTAQVIEFFDTFKAATGKTQSAPAPSAESVKEAAKQAIAQAKPAVPASLSDFPGGKVGPATGNEALANLGANEMAEALMDKTPEQIEAFLNRSV